VPDRNASPKGPTGSGQKIEDFVADARGLQPEEFEDRHGTGFLLLTASGFKLDAGSSSTEMILLADSDDAAARTAGVRVLVFPIRASESSHTHLITVGRTSNNDVTIPDISISRFHAYFKRSETGFQVLDAGSTNGTTVNGESAPTQGSGSPLDLKPGDSVRLGLMEMTFLDAAALREFTLQFDR